MAIVRKAQPCRCGSGLPGRTEWSQGLPDMVACPECWPQRAPKFNAPRLTNNPALIRQGQARRRLEALRDMQEHDYL